ncbi:histidine kinase [Streptomyces sp. NPDC051987]|uniref:sensor histidine kinase n=1 Tax=Streptomyces sp. NPDC051987 TaxID=3155808 RepID=UPI00343879FF
MRTPWQAAVCDWLGVPRSTARDTGIALLVMFLSFWDTSGTALGAPASSTWTVWRCACALIGCGSLVLRERLPLTVLGVSLAADLLAQLSGSGGRADSYAVLLAAGSAASRVGITPVSTAFSIAATLAESFAMRPLPGTAQAAAVCAVFQLVIMAGLRTGIRRERAQRTREHVERLYERSAAAARQHALLMRTAAAEERLRVAREVHDVLAHTISVVVIQATAAADGFEHSPVRAKAAVEAIGDVSRQALKDLRSLLNALHDDADAPASPSASPPAGTPRTPSQGDTDLSGLLPMIDHVRATGLAVDLDVAQPVPALPPTVALAAYRVVQEALTNTLRHAHARRAVVSVAHRHSADDPDGGVLVVEVADDGWGLRGGTPVPPSLAGSGRGLTGMAARVHALGGTVTSGNREAGGFQVSARIPVGATATAASTSEEQDASPAGERSACPAEEQEAFTAEEQDAFTAEERSASRAEERDTSPPGGHDTFTHAPRPGRFSVRESTVGPDGPDGPDPSPTHPREDR